MSDEKALLGAIWEHPHEDTPRLVYADWLQENGQPERAEFIRIQIELARLDEWDDSPRKVELAKREKQLWDQYAEEWKAELPTAIRKKTRFHRGFPAPSRQKLSPGKFLKLTTADLATAPLWNFEITANRTSFEQVLASPNLLRAGTLVFGSWLDTPDAVRLFVSSPNVRNVAELDLRHAGFDAAKVTELAAGATGLSNLRRLNFYFNKLTAAAVESLVRSPLAGELEEVYFGMNPLGTDGVRVLAAAPTLGRLRSLGVSNCGRTGGAAADIGGEVAKALCNSPHLVSLRALHIGHNGFGPADVRTMCESRPVFRLGYLSLAEGFDGMGDDGVKALAAWPALEHVRTLIVHGNRIGAAGGRALADSPYLNHVTELWLQGNPVLDDPNVMGLLRRRFGTALRLT